MSCAETSRACYWIHSSIDVDAVVALFLSLGGTENWGPRPFIYNPWWAAASWAEDERKLRRCCIIRQFDRRRRRRRLHPPTWNIRSFCCCCCSTVRQEKISSRCTHAIWSERVCIHQSPKGTRPGPVWPRVILTIDPWLALPLRIDEQVPRSPNSKSSQVKSNVPTYMNVDGSSYFSYFFVLIFWFGICCWTAAVEARERARPIDKLVLSASSDSSL